MKLTYYKATKIKELLEYECEKWGAILKTFLKGPMGLTPTHIKNNPGFIEAKAYFKISFQELRKFNQFYVKAFREEIKQSRQNKIGLKSAASALLLLTTLSLSTTPARAKDYAEALKQASQESYCVAPEQVPSPRGGVAYVGLTVKAPLPKDGGKSSKKRQSLEALIELKKAVRGACDAEVQ